MKRTLLGGFILVSIIVALATCKLNPGSDLESTDFFRLTINTTPYVARTMQPQSMSWQKKSIQKVMGSGMKYAIYYMFQEYTFPDDEGRIDSRNMYKLLHESSLFFSTQKDKAHAFSAAKLASPYDFGTAEETYDHGVNETDQIESGNSYDKTLAYRADGSTTYALLGYTVRSPASTPTNQGRNVIQMVFDESTGDIRLDFVTYGDYLEDNNNDFARRIHIEGNANSHEFFCQYCSTETDAPVVVGKGISRSTGSAGSDYYILCVVDNSGEHYFRLPADATQDNFDALPNEGTPYNQIVSLDPEGYAAAIQAYIATADFTARRILPASFGDFSNNGMIALPE